jgi:4-hydroxybenzoate polyprenyltransferase
MYSAIKPFLDLCRVSNLATVWTNVLAAVVLSGVEFRWQPFLVLLFSLSFLYSGGMSLNDLLDAQADRVKKPFRPLPSGRISMKSAVIFTALLFAAGVALLLFTPYPGAAAGGGLLLLALIIVYDWCHKEHPVSVILMAGCRLMVFVISATALTGSVALLAACAGLLQFFYVLVITLVARYENSRREAFSFPVIPIMIAGISLLDGAMMAVFAAPAWFAAGIGGALLTHFGQRFVRGD